MLSQTPRLRRDLVISQQHAADGTAYVLKDPVAGTFYRLRETERFITEQLDGETTLGEVRQLTEARFEAALNPRTLEAFVYHLEKKGLLEGAEGKAAGTSRGRVRGSLLYLRVKMFDPNRFFEQIEPQLWFFFTPVFLLLSAATVALAAVTVASNTAMVAADFSHAFRLTAIPQLLAIGMFIVSAHELAHGMTCKHFGGGVHEIGFILIYFSPAFYCNVSDAWLFPERSKRLWVSFAGPWFELFMWALATVVWRISEPDTGIHEICFFIMAISGVQTLFNFNPFIKLDGYYLLSDWLAIPNLRRKAFRHIGLVFRRWLGIGQVIIGGSPREQSVLLSYGMVATVGSVSALSYGVSKAGHAIMTSSQPIAVALVMALLAMKFRRRIKKLFGGGAGGVATGLEDDGEVFAADAGPPPPEVTRGGVALPPLAGPHAQPGTAVVAADGKLPAPPAPPAVIPAAAARRRRLPVPWPDRPLPRWKKLLLGAAVLVPVLFLAHSELRIGSTFTILPQENADVRAGMEGVIADVDVHEGDTVRAGDVIARLSEESLLADLGKTDAAVRENQAQLALLMAGATPDSLALARAEVSRATDQVRFAREKLGRTTELTARGAASRQELADAQVADAMARHELEEANRRLDVLLAGARPEEMRATRARIEGLETQRRFLDEEKNLLVVRSPITGIVATPARVLEEMRGQLVARGTLIAKVYDFSTVQAQMSIPEREIADVHPGQAVALKARAFPNRVFHGVVIGVATSAEGTAVLPEPAAAAPPPGPKGTQGTMFVVTTRIDNASLLLKPGMTGQGKIVAGRYRLVSLLGRRLARTFKVALWSWW